MGHVIFAIPAISGILLFKLMEVKALLIIFIPLALLTIPISAGLSWLIAKGSNWVNTAAAITAVCSLPGRIYGVLFGGLLGFHFFSTVGSVILAIVFYLFAVVTTIPLGRYLSSRVIPE